MSALCPCGHANAAGLRFCNECGRPLASLCSGCAAQAPDGARFCGMCGMPLRGSAGTSGPAIDAAPPPNSAGGERKQVTVLFADVARSMELAERLDPDELTQIMNRLFQICREAVERFGGTVDKFTGDGVMALFGAPIAQEDHARRACHAGLRLVAAANSYAGELRAQRGVDLDVRVGLNSGEVVAGAVGGPTGAYTAVGHTVGLAQRMEGLAEPGVVYLSEHTAALVGEAFVLRGLGRIEVKGSTLPVEVFALSGPSGATSAAGRRRSGSARLVGRTDELTVLQSALDAARNGRAQMIGLVAEAGAGKSRLCEELAQHAVGIGVSVRRTAGVSHAQDVPLLPILGLFRDYFTISADDAPADTRAKVSARLLDLDPELDRELGLMFDFLEVPDPARPAPQLGPDARRRRVLDVISRVTQRRSENETLLLILEDLHWFDQHSVAFLDAWLPSYPGTRTLIVTNFRPEFQAPWMRHSYYRQLPLAPLDPAAVTDLLAELLGPDPQLAALTERLRERAGGNPFFAEELVRGLADDQTLRGGPGAYQLVRRAEEVRVPPTVQAVLAARIDKLAVADKDVLQAAAVIGRTFDETILAAVSGIGDLSGPLQALRNAELLQATGTPGEYRFWHPLTQEVAYGTLLAAGRRRLHNAVAGALIDTAPDRHDEFAALIVTHFEGAVDDVAAARWQLRAGARAMRTDSAEAQRRWRSALEHLRTAPETSETLALGIRTRTSLVRLGSRSGMDIVESRRLVAEARPAAERLGDHGLLTLLFVADGLSRLISGDVTGAIAAYREASRQAGHSDDRDARAVALFTTAFGLIPAGPVSEGLDALAEMFEVCGDDPLIGAVAANYSVHDFGHLCQAIFSTAAGRLDDARQQQVLALDLFDLRPMAEWRVWGLAQSAQLADCTGEPAQTDQAGHDAAEAVQVAADSGNLLARIKAGQAAGLVALLQGRPDEAAVVLAETLGEARKHQCVLDEAGLLAQLARAHLAGGDLSAARARADEAVAVANRQGARVLECFAHVVQARVWRETATGPDELARSRAAATAGLSLATETGAVTYGAFLAEELARLDHDPVALRAAADGYTAIGATGHARRLLAELQPC